MKLAEWVRMQGVNLPTANQWFGEDRMPVPARRLEPGMVWVDVAPVLAPGRVF